MCGMVWIFHNSNSNNFYHFICIFLSSFSLLLTLYYYIINIIIIVPNYNRYTCYIMIFLPYKLGTELSEIQTLQTFICCQSLINELGKVN